MWRITTGFGIALLMLGAYAWSASSSQSPTALIPGVFGLVFVVCGVVAYQPSARMIALCVAVGLASLGVVASLWRAIPSALDNPQIGLATTVQLVLAGLLLAYIAAALRAYLMSRAQR